MAGSPTAFHYEGSDFAVHSDKECTFLGLASKDNKIIKSHSFVLNKMSRLFPK